MSAFRYDTTGRWYKGNTHVHTTASDGGKTAAELSRLYADAGYRFLVRADHWVASDAAADGEQAPLLWLDGIELDGADNVGAYFHVACLGRFEGISRSLGFVAALEAARAQGGLLILAHPCWTGNSVDDALRWGFHGVEIYNHVAQWFNGKGESLCHWNAMLGRAPGMLGLAVDDAHVSADHPGWNGGWIVVNARECSPQAILAAIRAGNFYSSCGPEMHGIEWDGRRLRVTCSPVQFARLVGPGMWGLRLGRFDEARLTEFEFDVPRDWPYVYLEVEDAERRRAWTNTLFVA